MAFGITSEGFTRKRLFDVKLEIENELKTKLGNNINLLDNSVLGQIVGIFAERESLLWELAEAIYINNNVDGASGVSLDNVLSLVGATRLQATKSLQQNLHLFGLAGSVIPANVSVSVTGSPTSIFKTKNPVTLIAGVDEVQQINFSSLPVAGQFRLKYLSEITAPIAYNATALDIQNALNALNKLDGLTVTGNFAAGFVVTFAGNSGKINHSMLDFDSNTLTNAVSAAVNITFIQTTAGVPQGVVDAEAQNTGEIIAPAFSLSNIDTPVTGLDRVTNPTEAIVGRDIESDNDFRARSKIAQKSTGSSTVEAIRAKLLALTGVIQVVVFENTTMAVDVNGLPAKSFRAYVQGGDDQDIWDSLWANKPAGIASDGTEIGTVVDSQGVVQTLKFSRPDVQEIYINIEITKDVAKFPLNGVDQVRSALADYVNSLEVGEDIIVYPRLISQLNSISGILDIRIGIDLTPAPAYGTDNNIPIAINQIAKVVDAANDIIVAVI